MKKVLFILALLLVDVAFAAYFFNPPYPLVNLRGSSGRVETLGLIAVAVTSGTVETDNGMDFFESGTLAGIDVDTGLPFSVVDTNVPNSNSLVELIDGGSVEVEIAPGNWVNAAGYSFAVEVTPGVGRGDQNGLGTHPVYGTTTYPATYQSINSPTATLDRMYGAPYLVSNAYAITVPGTGPTSERVTNIQQSGNLIVFASPGPVGTLTATTPGPCPAAPAAYFASGGNCYSFGKYVQYLDLAAGPEGTVQPVPATTAYGVLGVFEDWADISVNLVVRSTNQDFPTSQDLNVKVFDLNTGMDIATIPDPGVLVQAYPKVSYPVPGFVSFVEYPWSGMGLGWIQNWGDLHLYDIPGATRTIAPIASSVSRSHDVLFDGGTGILTYLQNNNGIRELYYVSLNSQGVVGSPVMIPPIAGMLDYDFNNLALSRLQNGEFVIDYPVFQAGGIFEVYRYNVQTGSSQLVFAGNGFVWDNSLTTTGDGRLLAFSFADSGSYQSLSYVLNLDCQYPPCSVYQAMNSFSRPNVNAVSVAVLYTSLDKTSSSEYAGRAYFDFTRLRIANI